MLARRPECSLRFVVPSIIIFILILLTFYNWNEIYSLPNGRVVKPLHDEPSTAVSTGRPGIVPDVDPKEYREVYSTSTPDGKYFKIDFVDQKAINPNILPHPTLADTWVIVAQRHNGQHVIFVQLVCDAVFKDGVLKCLTKTSDLPIANTTGDKCTGEINFISLSKGPHDGRVFYGPEGPYTTYGSNSAFTCFGQFVQDFRALVEWDTTTSSDTWFRNGTELQRPLPWGPVEKNWFMFWDKDGAAYVHYDISPKRVFAKLNSDGSIGEDLAPKAAFNDEKCMAKYMPHVGPELESIHQATNSLLITLCARSDPSCKPDDSNTFIAAIFHWKSFYGFHGVYEPYVILFERKAPFKVHGISTKPIWIHGRGKANEGEPPKHDKRKGVGVLKPWDQTEMLYVTSMTWKSHGQRYYGYKDDVVFLGFGIEDSETAGIDVVVGDFLMDIGLCSNS